MPDGGGDGSEEEGDGQGEEDDGERGRALHDTPPFRDEAAKGWATRLCGGSGEEESEGGEG